MNIIISGKKNLGKTTVAQKLVELLKQGHIPIGGELNVGNDIIDVITGEKTIFVYDSPMPKTIHIGRYYLLKSVLAHAKELIKTSIDKGAYTFIDECGKLELQRQEGFYDIINYALPKGNCIICVRDMNVDDFFTVFQQKRETVKVFFITEENRDSIPRNIYEYITQQR